MKMKKILAAMTAGLMCMGFAACSTNDNSGTPKPSSMANSDSAANAPKNTTSYESESAPAESSADTSAEDNTALSGKVTVYMPSPAGLADKIAADFTDKTGVQVDVFQGTTGEILARLEAETANPVADVVILASWSDGLSMKADGKIMSYTPANADKIVDGWIDADNTLFGYSASAVGIIYNTTVIPEMSADWTELADEQFNGLLAIPDPEKSGACKDFVAGFVNAFGWDAFEGMAANGMIVPGANKAALEAVTTGEVGALVAGVDYNAYSSIAKGEPLAIYYPAGGTVVNPRPAMIMNTAPNVDNAKAFVDYLFSDDAQKLVADAYLLPGRIDVKCEGRTNLEDIPQIECDWDKMMEIASDSAAKINEICG